ncbi:MAG: hypothetical protein ACKVQQ_11825 [Burkholderiales bacterium]
MQHLPRLTLAGITLALAASLATAADAEPVSEALTRYRAEMAICNSGQSSQSVFSCREEARNALAAARRGGLTAAPGEYGKNAAERCGFLTGSDRVACEARMRGEGTVEGSVAGGGILREIVTETIEQPK